MWSSGGSFRSFSRRVLLLAAFFATWCSLGLSAQTPPDSAPSWQSESPTLSELKSLLLQANSNLMQYLAREPERQRQEEKRQEAYKTLSEQMQASIADSLQARADSAMLNVQLTASETARVKAEVQAQMISGLFLGLRKGYNELSTSFSAYREASDQAIEDLQAQVLRERAEKLAWQIGGIVATVVLGGAAGYLGGHALGWW